MQAMGQPRCGAALLAAEMMRPAIIGETQPMKRSTPGIFLVVLLVGLVGVILTVLLLAVASRIVG